jgi:hypothetical protein
MMPTQLVSATVAVGTDAGTQPHYLGNQFVFGPVLDFLIHRDDKAVGASQVLGICI